MTLTLAYLLTLNLCWSPARLEQAARLWPSESPGWAWLLGDRLAKMTRSDAQLRVAIAFACIALERYELPAHTHGVPDNFTPAADVDVVVTVTTMSPSAAFAWFRKCSDEKFFPAAAALGAWLDAMPYDSPDTEPLPAAHALLALLQEPPR
jgi:hypothetical protein